MQGSYQFVHCFLAHAIKYLRPLDLVVLKQVSKTFYKYISTHWPNFGIERNLFFFTTYKSGKHFYVSVSNLKCFLRDGLTLFGPYLQALMLKSFGGPPLFLPKEVDFLCQSVPIALEIIGYAYSNVFFRGYDDNLYDKIESFELYHKGPLDFTIGPKDAAFHIGKSDPPFQRMFLIVSAVFSLSRWRD